MLVLLLGCSAPVVPPPSSASDSRGQSPEPAPVKGRSSLDEPDEIEGEPLLTLLPPDEIRAIDEPRFVTADEAEAFMDLDETVLGVVGADGTAKCYSTLQLDAHEIVNDVLDGRPIAATW